MSAVGLSAEESEWLNTDPTIKVGYIDGCLPYADMDEETGEVVGMLPAFMEHMYTWYGVHMEAVEFSGYEKMKEALEQKKIDLIFPAYGSYWTSEENNLMVTEPLTTSYLLMFHMGNYNGGTSSVIAITDASPMQKFYVKEHYPESQVLLCSDMIECIKAVASGKATCTLISSDTYYSYRNELDNIGEFGISNTGYEVYVSLACRKDDVRMYSFMKKGVSSMSDHEINEALMSGGYMNSEMSVRQFLRQHAMLVFMAGVMIIVLILGFLIYYVISSRKALRLARSNNELSEKAYVDLATGLPNKNRCEEIISSHLRITIPTAMFMLDLNDLKVVNDTLGHDMGDLMIMNFARILRQTVPLKYFVGRFGGDEFIVIAEGLSSGEEADQRMYQDKARIKGSKQLR